MRSLLRLIVFALSSHRVLTWCNWNGCAFKRNHHPTSLVMMNKRSIAEGNVKVPKIEKMSVYGDTSAITSNHPVIKAVIDRWIEGSKPGNRAEDDNHKIAVAMEGGGMRGCVAAGSAAAINFLGLNDAVDVVYGSSAGSMVASYFISRQFSGVQIYHDILPSAGKNFINKVNLVDAVGLPLNRLKRILTMSKLRRKFEEATSLTSKRTKGGSFVDKYRNQLEKGTPILQQSKASKRKRSEEVLDLDFLLQEVMADVQQLDWDTFAANDLVQPLKIVTANLTDMTTMVLSREGGHFYDLPSLLQCIRASMLVPGVAGRLVGVSPPLSNTPFYMPIPAAAVDTSHTADSTTTASTDSGSGATRTGTDTNTDTSTSASTADTSTVTPLADAFLTEPIPFRSAVLDGATHVIALRTRPDPCPVVVEKPSLYENVIAKRFFEKYGVQAPIDWLLALQHQTAYAKDVLLLNKAAQGRSEGVSLEEFAAGATTSTPTSAATTTTTTTSTSSSSTGARSVLSVSVPSAHILPIASTVEQDPEATEVSQLSTDRAQVLLGMRAGARRAFQLFLPAIQEHFAADRSAADGSSINTGINSNDDWMLGISSLTAEDLVEMVFPISMLDRQVPTVEDYRDSSSLQQGIESNNLFSS